MSDDGELRITEFEMNEQVFVPAGDGELAKWMQRGDLRPGEFERYNQGKHEAVVEYQGRVERYRALANEAIRRKGGDHVTPAMVFTSEEMAEWSQLGMVLEAQGREIDKREAAIAKDIAAGRYWTLEDR